MILNQFLLNSPNWNSSVRLRYTWQTAIKRGIQGNERRTKLKSWPRRSIAWSHQISTNYQRNLFLRKAFFNLQNVFGIPLWPYQTYLTQAASIDDTVIYCSTDYCNFANNQIVLITADFIDYDYGIISSFDSTSITLSAGLTNDFVLGAKVFPVLQARASDTTSFSTDHITGKISTIDFDFSEAYEDSQIFTPGSNSYSTYNSYYIFNNEPNWIKTQEITLRKPFEVLSNIGIDNSYCYQSETDFSMALRYSLYTAESINKFENFFNNMAGRYGNFWTPTWSNDFVITSAIANTDTSLTIENINYQQNWLTNDLIGRIIFIKYGSSEVARKITSAPSATSINLDSAIGIDVSEDGLRSIVSCFLLPVRFDIDELEIEYITDSKAEVEVRLLSLNDSDMIPT